MAKKTLESLTKLERGLLLYFESCAVDFAGRVHGARMNGEDFEKAHEWSAEGFIDFGRIVMQDHNRDGGNFVKLSRSAMALAQAERRARADRMWKARVYKTTREASSVLPTEATA
jgi:hypothetical protein